MMAAGQQKKRLTSSNLHDQYRGKKKKQKQQLDPSDYVLNFRSHVQLEWDDSRNRVIGKKEQVGVTWTDMAPFIDSPHPHYSGLADILSVPPAIFDLENLMEVLSYEVWAKFLSESDRKLLTQFLPSGTSGEQVLKPLLMGDNLHFGNPFLKWSTSLCSGDLHPDKVLQKERHIKADKRAYYSELSKYHNDILEILKKWREQWASCKDPEISWRKEFAKHKQEIVSVSTERTVVPISKKEIPHENCVLGGDVGKYMSYIKISKQQLQLIKNLKQNGDEIQPKSLNRVLGDIKDFVVEPYASFEMEERKRFNDHWLKVVNKDLSTAFNVWRDKKWKREEWSKTLKRELAEKMKLRGKEGTKLVILVEERMENGNSEPCVDSDLINQEKVSSQDIPELTQSSLVSSQFAKKRNPMEGDAKSQDQAVVCQGTTKPAEDSSVLQKFLGKSNPPDSVMEHKVSASFPEDMWQSVSTEDSCYQAAQENHRCPSASEISLGQLQPTVQVIDLERDALEHDTRDDDTSSLCSYAKKKHDELLQPFPNGPGTMPSYILRQFQEQRGLVEQRQGREKELYIHQIMNKNVYSNREFPGRTHIASTEVQDFAELPSSTNGGMASQSWFSDDHLPSNGWPGYELSNNGQNLGDALSADGSLFSVLSECRKLPSRPSYAETRSSERFIQAGNSSGADNVHGFPARQPNSSTPSDANVVSPALNNVSWNFSHQNKMPWKH
ncbi:Nuclear factor related to kappa-B-binding protein [Dioscorea alata]|uniref:Nuclear factor related to kappa-B-binding protein n=1 Tax=Dioscorea alata TaxID=55571 RepID=A0ACB7UTE3_DIOAL|nr:Nuclear factor related to kappa-B-binding protein [Dioscorea alata]